MTDRTYTTRRRAVIGAIVDLLKSLDVTTDYRTNFYGNVSPTLKFWDEIDTFPYVCVTGGIETREYLPAGFRWRFLTVTIRIYVHDVDDPTEELEVALEDIETILETNTGMEYIDNTGTSQYIADLRILSVDTDEGVLAPLAIGEMVLQIRY